MESTLLLFIVLFQHSVTAGNSDHRISIFADEKDNIILPLPGGLLFKKDQIDQRHQIDRVIWKKGEELIPSHYENRFGFFEDPSEGRAFIISLFDALILEAESWKDGEEYSAHVTLNDNSQSSVYYRVGVYSVTAGNSDTRISIFADEMDDIILQLPEYLWYQIDRVIWKKGEELIPSHFGNRFGYFLGFRYSGQLWSSFYGSLILEAESWKDGEEYSANIPLNDNSQFSVYYRVSVYSVTTENSDTRIPISALETDDVILQLPELLPKQTDLVLWRKGKKLIASSYGNGSLRIEDPGYREILSSSHDGSLILKARSWKAGEEYSAHIRLNDNSQSLIYYDVSVTRALCGAGWEKRTKGTLKIGENFTLQLPVNDSAAGGITDVIWAKGYNIFLQISKDKGTFLNKTYESIICSSNISSITICNATRSDTGLYKAQITYSDESNNLTVKLTYYVAEHLYFCDGTTYRNKIEGDNVTLHVNKDPDEPSWWSKNNINVTASENPKLSINDIGTLSIPNVRKEDEGNYTVTIVKENSHLCPLCNHTYILSISPSDIKSIRQDTEGLKKVDTTVGKEITLPWESHLDKSEIVQIDWLTDKWNYFAATKVGGDFRIVDSDYDGYLASTNEGFLTFKKVTKDYNGKYRACIFSNSGQIEENNYQVHVADTSSLDAYLNDDKVFASICIFIILLNIMFLKTLRSKQKENKSSSPPGKEKEFSSLQGKIKELLSLQGKEKEILSLQEENKMILHRIP